jgi:hypothetical protein
VTELAELGSRLRHGGLSPRTLATWVGSDRLSSLPSLLPRVAGRPVTPASALLALFVAGDDVAIDRIPELEALHRHDLVDVAGDRVRARVAILPLGSSLLVCDRLDVADGLDIVCWPDDSSYHLARSIPGTWFPPWLDLGCGSAFAALLQPKISPMIIAADINPRAVRYARLGLDLSGIAHVATVEADLGDGVSPQLRERCALVSCNAPIPEPGDAPYRARWRQADTSFIEKMFVHAHAFVEPEAGNVVVHAALDAVEPVLADLPGQRVVVAYTPADVRSFGVVWWQPGAEDRLVRARRPLTEQEPHLTYKDRRDAMAGTLAPL